MTLERCLSPRGISAILAAALLASLPPPARAQEPSTNPAGAPAIILLSKAAIDSSTTNRFVLLVEHESHGMVHITVVFPRQERDHLSAVALEVVEADKTLIRLPVKVAVDSNGDDRALFSTSATTAALCQLSVEIGPRYPGPSEQRIETIYRVVLAEFLAKAADGPSRDKTEPPTPPG